MITVLILLIGHFHGSNFGHAGGGFFTSHDAIKNILLTLPAGIIFSLLGFEQAVQLGGESANPGRDLPRAVILSILIGAALYILIQIAFIGALTPSCSSQQRWRLGPGRAPARSPWRSRPVRSSRSPASPASRGWPRCCGSTRSSPRAAPG